ncbi:MAG: hypothetical protein AAGG07_05805 [Planctomycetota bacterium]
MASTKASFKSAFNAALGRVAAGAGSGFFIGISLWAISKAGDDASLWYLLIGWTLIGGLIPIGGPALFKAFRTSLKPLGITTVEIGLPGLGKSAISLGNPQRASARRILLEMTTRTVLQPLDPNDGTIRAALDSLYAFFQAVREELKSMPATPPNTDASSETLESIAHEMLNTAVRPYTSRWHPRLDVWEGAGLSEDDWPLATDCRADLDKMRKAAAHYAVVLGKAGGILRLDRLVPVELRPTDEELLGILDSAPSDELEQALRRFDSDFANQLSPELREGAWRSSLDLSALSAILATDAPREVCVRAAAAVSVSLRSRLGRGIPGADPSDAERVIQRANVAVARLIGELEASPAGDRSEAIERLEGCARELDAVARGENMT